MYSITAENMLNNWVVLIGKIANISLFMQRDIKAKLIQHQPR